MAPLSLAQLRVLDAVVAAGSLQAAAVRLHRTHPTLHASLSKMEQALGFKLFDRSAYRLRLTREGAHYGAMCIMFKHEANLFHPGRCAEGWNSSNDVARRASFWRRSGLSQSPHGWPHTVALDGC